MLDRKLARAYEHPEWRLEVRGGKHGAKPAKWRAKTNELLGGREVSSSFSAVATRRNTTKLCNLSDIVSIMWLHKSAFKNLCETRMSPVERGVPSYGKAEVLVEAISESKDLEVVMRLCNPRYAGYKKPKDTRRRYIRLIRIPGNTIFTERQRAPPAKGRAEGDGPGQGSKRYAGRLVSSRWPRCACSSSAPSGPPRSVPT